MGWAGPWLNIFIYSPSILYCSVLHFLCFLFVVFFQQTFEEAEVFVNTVILQLGYHWVGNYSIGENKLYSSVV